MKTAAYKNTFSSTIINAVVIREDNGKHYVFTREPYWDENTTGYIRYCVSADFVSGFIENLEANKLMDALTTINSQAISQSVVTVERFKSMMELPVKDLPMVSDSPALGLEAWV